MIDLEGAGGKGALFRSDLINFAFCYFTLHVGKKQNVSFALYVTHELSAPEKKYDCVCNLLFI